MNKAHPGGFTSCEPSSKVLLGERAPPPFRSGPSCTRCIAIPVCADSWPNQAAEVLLYQPARKRREPQSLKLSGFSTRKKKLTICLERRTWIHVLYN